MNAPDRMDAVRVPADKQKVTMAKDEKMPNAATFKLLREDHTLGNLLRMELLRDPRVKFVGYRHPHPLEYDILVKVQTDPASTPITAVQNGAKRLENEFRELLDRFTEDVRRIEAEQEEIH